MDDTTYTDRMQMRHQFAREIFLDLLEKYREFRTEAESVGKDYGDLLETRWETLQVNLHQDQQWDNYCASVIELCRKYGFISADWAPEAVHHVIGRITTNQPTHHYMSFYYDPIPKNKRARFPSTLRQQVEVAFMRIVRGMSDQEIWVIFPDDDYDFIRQQISRGASELGIELR